MADNTPSSSPFEAAQIPSPIPNWARWLAQDADGGWWAYEAEPHPHDTGWYENEVGRCALLVKTAANPEWQQSLWRVQTAQA